MKVVVPFSTLVGLSIALSLLGRPKQGMLLGLPYNLEWPTPDRIRRAIWNPRDPHVLTPHAFGWGYSVNLHALARQLKLV